MKRLVCVLPFLLLSSPASAGVFIKAPLASNEPFIVVHPTVYNGVGGTLELKICSTTPNTKPAIQESIRLWNERQAVIGNCRNCVLWEDPVPSPPFPPTDMLTVVFHELGHCAMALDHTSWRETSFTNSQSASSFAVGADMIRGSRDDAPSPLPGTRLIHWFRLQDNNPIVIDSTVIDQSTYTRRIIDLPAGSTWPANANRCVSQSLGVPFAGPTPCPVAADGTDSTQSPMYTLIDPGMQVFGLAADDINTTAFSMTGLDLQASTTDDYTVTLVFENDCSQADIEVDYVPLVDGILGACYSTIEPIGSAPVQVHYRIVPAPGIGRLLVEVDSTGDWNVLFVGDFENGSTMRWSATVP